MLEEDFDLEEEIRLVLEDGSKRYFEFSNAHNAAFNKYVLAAKRAKEDGNAGAAKKLRALGRKHARAAQALADIASHHVDYAFAKGMREEVEELDEGVNARKGHEALMMARRHDRLADAGGEDSETHSAASEHYHRAAASYRRGDGVSGDDHVERARKILGEDAIDERHLGFKKLERKLAHEKGVDDPAALAAAIGRKKYGKKRFNKMAHEDASGEDMEHIDEISKKTLGKYIHRAVNDVRNSNQAIGRRDKGDPFRDVEKEDGPDQGYYHREYKRIAKNREAGIRKATDRLTQEDTVDLLTALISRRPVDFQEVFQEAIRDRAAEILEDIREELISEISNKTLRSYIKKGTKSHKEMFDHAANLYGDGTGKYDYVADKIADKSGDREDRVIAAKRKLRSRSSKNED